MVQLGSINGINFYTLADNEVVVNRVLWDMVSSRLQAIFPMISTATKPMEQCGTANNNARVEIKPLINCATCRKYYPEELGLCRGCVRYSKWSAV